MVKLPSEIRLVKDKATLIVVFDGQEYELPAEYLRVYSPSAEVRGHGVGQEKLQVGKKDVVVHHIESSGNYALKITFSDGHDSGLFDWNYLYELATQYAVKWAEYLLLLEKANANR